MNRVLCLEDPTGTFDVAGHDEGAPCGRLMVARAELQVRFFAVEVGNLYRGACQVAFIQVVFGQQIGALQAQAFFHAAAVGAGFHALRRDAQPCSASHRARPSSYLKCSPQPCSPICKCGEPAPSGRRTRRPWRRPGAISSITGRTDRLAGRVKRQSSQPIEDPPDVISQRRQVLLDH